MFGDDNAFCEDLIIPGAFVSLNILFINQRCTIPLIILINAFKVKR